MPPEVLLAVDRADADDGAPAGGDQVRQRGTGAAVGAVQGDVEGAGPGFVGLVLEERGVVVVGVGVVDQDVEPAERGDRVGHRRVDRRTVAHVAGQGFGGAARLAYRGRRALGASGVEVGDQDGRALGGQPAGGGRPDALSRAGEERGVPVEARRRSHSADRTALTRAWARGSAVTPFCRPFVT